jgi:hypothetical protein
LPARIPVDHGGNGHGMRKVIRRHVRHRGGGVDVAFDLNAVIAVNDGDTQQEVVTSHVEATDDTRRTRGTGPATEPDREQESPKEDR